MSGKGIPRKTQDSGTAGSGSSESKRCNCSKIDAEGATINSGCGSGNNGLKEVGEHIKKGPSKGCKGTDGFNDIHTSLAGNAYNFGALSGNDTKRHGTSSNPEGSNVNGTRNSFNATGTGWSPSKRPKQDPSCEDSAVPGSENSFNDRRIYGEATVHAADGCPPRLVGGTRGSFNVNGANIDARGATINSGCGAGTGDAEGVRNLIERDRPEECSGTEQAFNAGSGGQININGARLNTGAYSGSAAQERGTASHS